jgi:hypothetical protein
MDIACRWEGGLVYREELYIEICSIREHCSQSRIRHVRKPRAMQLERRSRLIVKVKAALPPIDDTAAVACRHGYEARAHIDNQHLCMFASCF